MRAVDVIPSVARNRHLAGACRSLALLGMTSALLGMTARAAFGQTNLLIVSGIGGQPEYVKLFADLSTGLAEAASRKAGLPDSAIAWFGETAAHPSRWFRGQSTKANVQGALQRLAARPGAEQTVIVLVGHGAGEGASTRVSLPGADLTATDFQLLLGGFGNRKVAFVNLTSASGDMLAVLRAPGRVVLTATKSAFERNESRFGRYFVEAFTKDGADTDKDDRISLLEAFNYAAAEVKRFYENAGRLATEHPQLADDDQLARAFFLTAGAPARAAGDPRLAGLYARRDSLDAQVRRLRDRKGSMEADAYERELERLLVALAETSEEIRKREGVK